MANLSDLVPLVAQEIYSVPNGVAISALRFSLEEFCDQSTYWRGTFQVAVAPSTSSFVLDPSSVSPDARVAKVLHVSYDVDGKSNHVDLVTPQQLELLVPHDRKNEEDSRIDYATQYSSQEISIVPMLNAANTLDVEAALRPTPTATTIDDDIYSNYREVITHGALARLYIMPGKSWHSPGLYQEYMNHFSNSVRDAKRKVENAHVDITRCIRYGGI